MARSDKRELAGLFRKRLAALIARAGEAPGRFAERIGLDRSAISHFLDPASTRMPRAEALCDIARAEGVTTDWLLGLAQSQSEATDIAPALQIEQSANGRGETLLAAWHQEAAGYKIRYVPATLPDLVRSDAVLHYEFAGTGAEKAAAKAEQTKRLLAYTRRPETDMEVCMPLQTLRLLADGSGAWSGLTRQERRDQLELIARLADELYPTFRLFLFDGRDRYAAPYTVFGPQRAALYLGSLYLVVNSVEHIRALTRHFDMLIRDAVVGPDKAAAHLRDLASDCR
ncbi:helix-turn-helix domain-containing protein [Stappia stellulata]|uniref:helix-turn-helix domain-containing protein n=1 Tax=Stappia stellulata TaxID=71235 RepID=UPI0003FBD22E|nr:helix-turn-helix transcriptional regulator [Stappia stellulata]